MRIAVAGLGNMGRALALALARGGREVAIWNRTPRDVAELAAAGANPHGTLASAVADADVVLLVTRSYATSYDALKPLAGGFKGKTLVAATSGLPTEAKEFAAWATAEGARSLDMAIMGYPSDVGSDRILYLHSGEKALFNSLQPLMAPLGPRHRHVGADPGAAKTYDNVLLARSYSWMMGYLQATAIAKAAGLDTTEFTEISMGLLGPLFGNIERASKEIAAGRYAPAKEAALDVHHMALATVLEMARQAGARTPVLSEVHRAMATTIAAGMGDREVAACFTAFEAKPT